MQVENNFKNQEYLVKSLERRYFVQNGLIQALIGFSTFFLCITYGLTLPFLLLYPPLFVLWFRWEALKVINIFEKENIKEYRAHCQTIYNITIAKPIIFFALPSIILAQALLYSDGYFDEWARLIVENNKYFIKQAIIHFPLHTDFLLLSVTKEPFFVYIRVYAHAFLFIFCVVSMLSLLLLIPSMLRSYMRMDEDPKYKDHPTKGLKNRKKSEVNIFWLVIIGTPFVVWPTYEESTYLMYETGNFLFYRTNDGSLELFPPPLGFIAAPCAFFNLLFLTLGFRKKVKKVQDEENEVVKS